MFDWNDLRHFLAVARCGSTISAAKALNVNQSTVHRRLEELEKGVGRRLFVRQPTGYKLTEIGQDIVSYAEKVEETVQALQRRLAASDTERIGTIRVTCPEVLGLRLMRSQLIEKFNSQYPGLRVEMVISDRYLDLAKGEADVAFRAVPISTDPTLFGRKIVPSPWAVYASKGYIELHGNIQRGEEINRHAVIQFEASMREHPAARWLQSVAPEAKVTARGSSLPAVLTAVKSGVGVGILPVNLGDNESDLVRLFGPIPNLPSDIYLLIHEDMKETPRVRVFFNFIISELATVRQILDAESGGKSILRPPNEQSGKRKTALDMRKKT